MKRWIIISIIAGLFTNLSCTPKKEIVNEGIDLKNDFTEIQTGKLRESFNEEDCSRSPYFHIENENQNGSWLPLKSSKANVTITGNIANVTVRQTYVNNSKEKLDAVYVFPGSTRAAVYGLDMTIGKRTIHAKVKEREEARKGFEQAKKEGKRATLLEQDRPNVFRMEVSNILPGDTIKVDMFYTELIEYRNKEYEFVFPTSVGPRYSTGNENFVSQSIRQLKSDHQPDFDIHVKIEGAVPVQKIESSTYPVKFWYDNENSANIILSNPKDATNGKDFILYYSLQGEEIENGLTLFEKDGEKFFMYMMQPPQKVMPETILPREYIFIVDVSGSMNGFPLDISKAILKELISSLRPIDRFNVLLFESSNAMMAKESLPATSENIQKAINVIDEQRGGGGTELYPALKTAFNYKDPELDDYARTFIIATDGYVTIENEAFHLIRNNLNNANFVPLGIGSGVNRFLIEGIAWAGASEPYIIENKTKAENIGKHLIKTISEPLLTDISIDWGKLEPYDIYPQKIPNIFSERPIVVYGKYKGNDIGNIRIKGKTANGIFNQTITPDKIRKSENEAIRYLWARNKIKYLSDYAACLENEENNYFYHQTNDKYKDEITKLGLKYNLLTKYTSFLAIDNGQTDLYDAVYEDIEVFTEHCDISPMADIKLMVQEESIKECESNFKTQIFQQVEIMPEFPDGGVAMMEFIRKNLKYPEELNETSISGRVILKFVIDENGYIKDITVIRSLHPLLDDEAIRVVKLMPQWIPGKQNNKNVAVYFTLPVSFKLASM